MAEAGAQEEATQEETRRMSRVRILDKKKRRVLFDGTRHELRALLEERRKSLGIPKRIRAKKRPIRRAA
jgi:hypothetical protein